MRFDPNCGYLFAGRSGLAFERCHAAERHQRQDPKCDLAQPAHDRVAFVTMLLVVTMA
jgi:hypothetical protein